MKSSLTSGRWLPWLRRYALPAAFALIFILPLLWMLSNSLQQPGDPQFGVINLLPNPVQWSNYVDVFKLYPLGQSLLNSIFVTGTAVPLTLITASFAGFAMAQLPAIPRRRLLFLTILLLIVPVPALWLPRFLIYSALNLIDSLFALIVPALMGSSPFFVLLFYWTFRRIPRDLFDSARLDGANALRIWWSVALPLAKPTISVVTVLTFVLYWGDYISPLVYLRSEPYYTFSLRLQIFTQYDVTKQPLAMAAVVISIAPIVILFLLVQRYFWPEGRQIVGR